MAVALILSAATVAHAGAFSVSGSAANNVDSDPATTVDLIVPPGTGTITDLNVQVALDSNWSNEVEVSITHSAVTVTLVPRFLVGDFNAAWDLTFDDAAGSTPPLNAKIGTYQPTGPGTLADFNGLDASGTWTLSLFDPGVHDGTNLTSWTVFGTATTVPEPGSVALFAFGALGLVGLVARRRRRRAVAPPPA